MSIHFISGKPGGGKTLYSVKLILEELRWGRRLVVTNVSLNLGRLNEYLQKTFPKEDIDLHSRIKLLDENQAKEFWKHRTRIYEAPVEQGGFTMLVQQDVGAFIVLDELHLFFNAREWMNTGPACLHYLSQHRKLGDDVICITQHVENVDKQFRSVAQDFTLIVNGFKTRVGLFRGLPMFHRYTFSSPPNGLKLQPDDTGHFRLDAKGIASCYDTAAGIGVHGRAADKEAKPKGLHPLWFPVLGIAAILIIIFGVKGCNKAVQASMSKKSDAAAHPSPASQSDAKQGEGVAPASSEVAQPHTPPQQLHREQSFGGVADRPLVVQKLVRKLRNSQGVVYETRVRVVLSDGRVYESSGDELEVVTDSRVKISGEWYYYKQPGPGQKTHAPPVSEMVGSLTPPETRKAPPQALSSWEEYSDGTTRLREPETMGTLFAK